MSIIFTFVRFLMIVLVAGGVIGGIVALIVAVTKKSNPGAAETISTPATPSAASGASSRGTATIFINGGAPASGNIMGKITVDGNSLTVRYTDAPLEITIPTGRHHVVVEGGVVGDARIDRFMDFGILDVWTVDLPGGNDADVIRHQMIGYSEYKQALREANFFVTKKEL